MAKDPNRLNNALKKRKEDGNLRELSISTFGNIDFSSNDYLGFSNSQEIYKNTLGLLNSSENIKNGATGSRLLTGNSQLYNSTEIALAQFYNAEAALIFNSGYDANLGLLSSVTKRLDVILYDELAHASIRDGIKLSNATSYKFKHNDLSHLEKLILKHQNSLENPDIFIVTESVFSMDGDSPNLQKLCELSEKYNCFLIVDEAHATGVFGNNGEGLICHLGLNDKVFARLITFGKALGTHGAAILGSKTLKDYLINFSRSFIYTTALPPHTLATILEAHNYLKITNSINKLRENIVIFNEEVSINRLTANFIKSQSAIYCCIIPGNENVKEAAKKLQQENFNVKAILSPTVPLGQERLRICIHSFNTRQEMKMLLKLIGTFIK